jgi:hypothetical protein
MRTLVVLLTLLSACNQATGRGRGLLSGGGGPGVGGVDVPPDIGDEPEEGVFLVDFIRLDFGTRWTFADPSGSAPYDVVVTREGQSPALLAFTRVCDGCEDAGEWMTLEASSDDEAGLILHGHHPAGGEPESLDDGVVLAFPVMFEGERIASEVGGEPWTSTLLGVADCDSGDCVEVALEADHVLAGVYTFTWGVGPSGFRFDAEGTSWELSAFE